MSDGHTTRGKSILGSAAVVVGLCLASLAIPDAWLGRVGELFGAAEEGADPFTDEAARLDAALDAGEATAVSPELVSLVAARRLTRAGPMNPDEVQEAARLWLAQPDIAPEELSQRFPRLNPDALRVEVETFRAQLSAVPPGTAPASSCASCHRETLELPEGAAFDVRGIYPFGADTRELAGGRRVPLLAESIELDAVEDHGGTPKNCQSCHVGHGADDFEIDRAARIKNMGLWVDVEPSDANVLQIRVKVKNAASGHRAPAGRLSPAYVVTVEARQHREPLGLRFGNRLPGELRTEGREAGLVFSRDFRDAQGDRTSDPTRIANLVADTRLESGRFHQASFLFDRRDTSLAHLEVVLWHLPDVTTWKGAKAIRRASKPEVAETP